MKTFIALVGLILLSGCGGEEMGPVGGRGSNRPGQLGGVPNARSTQALERSYPCPPKSEEIRRHGTMRQRIQQQSCYGLK